MTGVVGLTGVVGFGFVLVTRGGVAGVTRDVGAAFFAEPVAPVFLPTGEAGDCSGCGRALGFASDGERVRAFFKGEPEAL